MHGLKQSFKHECSFRLNENISKRVSKNLLRMIFVPAVWEYRSTSRVSHTAGTKIIRKRFLLTRFEMFSFNLKEHSCLKDCFNPCIYWSFSELPCLCSGPKSSPNLAKESERASAASSQP